MKHQAAHANAIDTIIRALRSVLAKAMVDVTVACKELDQEHHLAAVGAIVMLAESLEAATSLHGAILVLNRQLR